MKSAIFAGALMALVPFAAAAVPVTGGGGWSGDPFCSVTGSSADTAANIDVIAGAAFNSEFANGDAAGHMCFNFNNSSSSTTAVTLAVATVNQGGVSWGFRGGVSLESEQIGPLWTVAEGVAETKNFHFVIGALSTLYFDWTYGKAYNSTTFNHPQINFTVSRVPVPAAGLLLAGALGGLGALRRRRKAA